MLILKKIRWKLLFFFLVAAFIPLVLISFLTLREVYSGLEKNIIGENMKLAAQVKSSIIGQIEYFKKQLSALGGVTEMKTFDRDRQRPAIRNFFRLNSFFYNIHVYDSTGVLKNIEAPSGFDRDAGAIGRLSVGDAPRSIGEAVRKAMEDKEAVVSELFVNSYGENAVCIAAPVFEFGSDSMVAGALSAAAKISDSSFHRFLDHVELYDNEYVLIVNSSAEVLTMRGGLLPYDLGRYDFDVYRNGRKVPTVEAFFSAGEAIALVGGRKDLIFITPIKELNSAIITGRPYQLAFWELRSVIRYMVWVTLLGLLTAAALSAFISERLARPIVALAGGLNRAGRGIYSEKIERESEDELGEAVDAFNKLTKKLYQDSVIDSFWREKWRG